MKALNRNLMPLMILLTTLLIVLLAVAGCSDRDLDDLEIVTGGEIQPNVFIDGFSAGLDFSAFADNGAYLEAISIDNTGGLDGSAALRFTIPADRWTGGWFYTSGPRDLSGFNALVFAARASTTLNLNSVGFGIGSTSTYESSRTAVPLTPQWQEIVIPVPNPSRMTLADGMFWLSEAEGSEEVDIWFDNVRYEDRADIIEPNPVMGNISVTALLGEVVTLPPMRTSFTIGFEDVTVNHTGAHFDLVSSDPTVVEVDDGVLRAVGAGTATVTGSLNGVAAQGAATVIVLEGGVNPYVYLDDFRAGLDFGAFADNGAYLEALSIDNTGGVDGSSAMKFTIPAGRWMGGWYYTSQPVDFSAFNALLFDVRGSQDMLLNEAGFGIGSSHTYQAMRTDIPMTTEWTTAVIPVPNPERMASTDGLFYLSDAEAGAGDVEYWIDNVRYENLTDLATPQPRMDNASLTGEVGETVNISGTRTVFTIDGEDITIPHTAAHFDYISSDPSVATVLNGVVTLVGGGTATVTAQLGEVAVEGEVTVTCIVIEPPSEPAPAPPYDESDVIALFSDAYTAIPVDTWRTNWSSPTVTVEDTAVDGDNMKLYGGLINTFVGIEFIANQIDATGAGMTHFHLDFFAPEGMVFNIKLVDFGADGTYDGGDDTEHTIRINPGSNPPFVNGEWISVDVPLADMGGMNATSLSQLVLDSVNVGDVWIDNIYFHNGGLR